MPQQIINLGATGSGAGGDSARTAFEKAMANFAELYIAALPGTAAQKQAARDMFGLGTAARRMAQTSATDTTAGALMAVGAFGLGSIGAPEDLNSTRNATASFVRYEGSGAGSNAPTTRRGAALEAGWVDTEKWQLTVAPDTERAFVRARYSGTPGVWKAWRELFHTGNILGTVSQSGGVPTGAIIERGSNSNGEYVRFADGTQICFGAVVLANIPAGGSVASTVTFPASFVRVPEGVGSSVMTELPHRFNSAISAASGGSARVALGDLGNGTASGGVRWMAIGRWF